MKWMFAAILLCGTSMNAQAQNDEIRHEISISYGGPTTSFWASIGTHFADAFFQGMGGAKYENTSFFGSLSAEYFYHVAPSIGIGGILCYTQDNDDILNSGSKVGSRTIRYITVMPAVKWNYLRRNHFGMYMKAAVGYSFRHLGETYKGQDESKNDGIFNVQLSLLGIEAGSRHVRGFVELGFGEQGVALAGLRFKF